MKDLVVIILSELSRYLESLIGLLSGPKSFVGMQVKDSENMLVQSFTFLGVSFVLNSLLFSSLLPTGVDFLQRTASHAVFALLAILMNAGALQISWWIVGGQGPFNKQLVIFLYYTGISLLITGACLLFALGAMKSFYPGLFEPLKLFIMSDSPTDTVVEQMKAIVRADNLAGLAILIGLFWLPIVARWVWRYVGWGAYRELNLTSKRASAMAFILYFILSSALLPLLYLIARAME